MVNDALANYVKDMLKKDVSKEQLIPILKKSGYSDQLIKEVFGQIEKNQQPNLDNLKPVNANISKKENKDSRKISNLAIAALVLGLVPFTGLIALVLGIIALRSIDKNPDLKGKDLAIAGMILGVVLPIVFMPIVATLYFSALGPSEYLPDRCVGPEGFDCIDNVEISKEGLISFTLKNNLGYDILLNQVIATECGAEKIESVNGYNSFPVKIQDKEKASIIIKCDEIKKEDFEDEIGIEYLDLETDLSYRPTVRIRSRIE